jgi:ribonuclease BN (tRNA processing enzyme)
MLVKVLGCRAGMPADGQASSGYLVTTASTSLLLDCGPGVATALSGIDRPRLNGVVISHLHLDHCYDLLPVGKGLLAAGTPYPGDANPPAATTLAPPVPLYVPAGGRSVLGRLAALFPVTTMPVLNRVFDLAFDVREYQPHDVFQLGDCRITMHQLRHAAPNCGTRVDTAGGSLAYTGDTGMTDTLLELADHVDLLLCEATLASADKGPHGHLSAEQAGQVAAAAQAGQLVLTHFRSADRAWLEARRADAERIFDGPVHLATPNREFEVHVPPAITQ